MSVESFFKYARAREQLRLNKEADFERPWTPDKILQSYRFCNVFRDDDKTTRWFKDEILSYHTVPADTIFACVVFRCLNKIETGELLKDLLRPGPVMFRLSEMNSRLRAAIAKGPILSPAYMIKTPLYKDKVTGLMEMWSNVAQDLEFLTHDILELKTIEGAVKSLCDYPFIGPFMAYEMATDLTYTPVLQDAKDRLSWANPGPGAARGLGRVFHQDVPHYDRHRPEDVESMIVDMRTLLGLSAKVKYWPPTWRQWDMRTVEHTLCEFDKYERARLGEGRPKQRYNGGK